MMLPFVLFIYVGLSSANLISPRELLQKENVDGDLNATLNDYIEYLFINVRKSILNSGLDPLDLPDINKHFAYRPLLITYWGSLDLTSGTLQDLSSIQPIGNSYVSYEKKIITVEVPIGFRTLQFDYSYKAKLMGLGPSGGVEGKVDNLRIYVKITLDFEEGQIAFDDFQVRNTGSYNIRFYGHILVDWFMNLLTNITINIFKQLINSILQSMIHDSLQTIVDEINTSINIIFGKSFVYKNNVMNNDYFYIN